MLLMLTPPFRLLLALSLAILLACNVAEAWCTTTNPTYRVVHGGSIIGPHRLWQQHRTLTKSHLGMLSIDVDSAVAILSSSTYWLSNAITEASQDSTTSTGETWRQYVPLAVSGFVLVDIALGSPAANKVLGAMRPPGDGDDAAKKATGRTVDQDKQKKMALIDTEAFAQAALDKASATLELRNYLDSNKSDWDKMEDIKREMDKQMQDLDRKNRPSDGSE